MSNYLNNLVADAYLLKSVDKCFQMNTPAFEGLYHFALNNGWIPQYSVGSKLIFHYGFSQQTYIPYIALYHVHTLSNGCTSQWITAIDHGLLDVDLSDENPQSSCSEFTLFENKEITINIERALVNAMVVDDIDADDLKLIYDQLSRLDYSIRHDQNIPVLANDLVTIRKTRYHHQGHYSFEVGLKRKLFVNTGRIPSIAEVDFLKHILSLGDIDIAQPKLFVSLGNPMKRRVHKPEDLLDDGDLNIEAIRYPGGASYIFPLLT